MENQLQQHINKEVQGDVRQLYRHADIANKEMGAIKQDIAWIKQALDKMDNRIWAILGTTVVGFLTSILLILIK